MITKEQFVDIMKRIVRYHEQEDALDAALRPFGYEYTLPEGDCLEQIIIDTLEYALNDEEGWVSYFLYERDGDLSEKCVYENDIPIDTSDWGKVYDLIISRQDG